MDIDTAFEILGLDKYKVKTMDEVTKKYRELARQYHPDKNRSANATQLFQTLGTAYEAITKDPPPYAAPYAAPSAAYAFGNTTKRPPYAPPADPVPPPTNKFVYKKPLYTKPRNYTSKYRGDNIRPFVPFNGVNKKPYALGLKHKSSKKNNTKKRKQTKKRKGKK